MRRIYITLIVACACVASDGVRTDAQTDPHAYFNALVARGDHWRSFSLRPKPGEPVTSPHYEKQLEAGRDDGYTVGSGDKFITYDPSHDPDPNRQDAAKVRIPAMYSPGSALASNIDASTTMIPLTVADGRWENNRAMKIDGEIMIVNGPRVENSVPVLRGQHGTAAASHASGATVVLSVNSLQNQVRLPLETAEDNTYMFTWDTYYTSSYSNTSLINHKAFQVSALKSGTQWFEIQTRFSGPPSIAPNPAWNKSTDVAATTARGYSQYGPGVTDAEPLLPMTSAPFIIKPNTWTRFWIVVEANRESDASAFANVTTLASPIGSASATTITISHPTSLVSNPFTAATSIAGAGWPGRALRIGNEIMTIVSGETSGTVRDLVVVRGAYGTAASVHSAGANVQLVHDYVSMYMADEDRDAVMLYNRIPMHLPINTETAAARGTMNRFWLEFNTSTSELTRPDLRDLVAYVRNFVALVNPPSDLSPLLLRPAAGIPPPYSGPSTIASPANLRLIR